MISEEIKSKLFDKNFDGDYRVFFIAIIDELNRVSGHVVELKSNAVTANENVVILFKKHDVVEDTLVDLKERDKKIEYTSNLSLKISVFALFLIVIIGWQTTPLTMDRIAKATSWIIEKL